MPMGAFHYPWSYGYSLMSHHTYRSFASGSQELIEDAALLLWGEAAGQPHQRTARRVGQSNGRRQRSVDTRAGRLEPGISKLRQASQLPISLLRRGGWRGSAPSRLALDPALIGGGTPTASAADMWPHYDRGHAGGHRGEPGRALGVDILPSEAGASPPDWSSSVRWWASEAMPGTAMAH